MNKHNSYEAQVMENELSLESGMFGPVVLQNLYVVTSSKVARNGQKYEVGHLVSKHEAWFFDLTVELIEVV